ncbi:MAG: hypothetical protein AAB909_03260 [Patescibacteria group bacterium]
MLTEAWLLLKQSFEIFKKHWKYLFSIYLRIFLFFLIPFFVTLALSLFFGSNRELVGPIYYILGSVMMIFMLIFGLILVPFYLLVTKSIIADQEPSFRELFSQSKKLAPSVVWTGFVQGACVLGGLILFVVPGLILAVWFAFSQYIVVENGVSGFKALQKSKVLLRGRFWEAALFLSLLTLMTLLLSFLQSAFQKYGGLPVTIVFYLVSVLISIVSPIYMYLVYRRFASLPAKT